MRYSNGNLTLMKSHSTTNTNIDSQSNIFIVTYGLDIVGILHRYNNETFTNMKLYSTEKDSGS